ncbi:MAG: hypothetical protein COS35_04995 [Zetaproteobacteria bacterium CG02_land_8_20_14_3_00_50_9]|nr:MAG: hypothetical protein AUJ56_00945 [Zetaproteobacteria bacterium CG1_02_49_23]PIQ32934.1 MAG: hypothetical protein COW62_06580 [Zetaproteobacteria bacterium CG17_big_fil_post_rev_8_21_14_2_50_50_13]PIV30761.1 MAG: hypothetical protein COS35_04995 [Zetaproteobacteria bacterium CG02_land_8_20_14_3_00_50_9]PIY56551.1 MAG: hypothetical protein COZ00_03640 [Zetaproteobacteria bacterium CG_4_10_14_0_8_um_filter_49_80]
MVLNNGSNQVFSSEQCVSRRNMAMLKILPLCCLVFAIGSLNACSNNKTANSATKTISITLTDRAGAPAPGITVRIDQSGTTMVTDAAGKAAVSGLSSGAHDIHIFPSAASGFQWESIYRTSATQVAWTLSKNEVSFVEYSGTTTNMGTGNTLVLLLEDPATGDLFSQNCTTTVLGSYTCSIQVDGMPSGASGNFNLWALEKNTANTVINGIQLRQATTYSVNTVTQGNGNLVQNIVFSVLPQISSNQLTISNVTPPAGVTATAYAASAPTPLNIIGVSTVLGNPVSAYNPFPAASPMWTMATNIDLAGNFFWALLSKKTAFFSNITLTSTFTGFPTILSQNMQAVGSASIQFQPAQGTFSAHQLKIKEQAAGNRTLWNITLPPTLSTFSLPDLPAGVAPVLANGTTYNVNLMAIAVSGSTSYDQFTGGIYDPSMLSYSDIELMKASAATLTR